MPSRRGTRASSKEAPPRRSELRVKVWSKAEAGWDRSPLELVFFITCNHSSLPFPPSSFPFCVCGFFCPEVSLGIEQYSRSKLFSWGGGGTKYLLL